jgi:hypothetical protein
MLYKRFALRKNRTIVLLLILSAAVFVLGCTAAAPIPVTGTACPPEAIRLCEVFGPEMRCRCADRPALQRALGDSGWADYGMPAW